MQKNHPSEATISDNNPKEPAVLLQRIGSTTYIINIHSSDSNADKAEDKLFRLIEREVLHSA